jgi:2-keto-4-pentenoate hydratase
MTEKLVEAAARLRNAYGKRGVPPLRDILDETDGEGAYAIQAINTKFWTNAGRRIVGRKVGLTAKAVQAQLGVDQPDYGVLFEDMRVPDQGALSLARSLHPKAEAEVALILGRDLDDQLANEASVAKAVEGAVAAIEIVDSRIADWKISFADTVADNGSSSHFVLGATVKPLEGLDLYSCGMVLQLNGEIASLGAGAACLGHPLTAAAWLARTLTLRGDPLRSGDIILTGALGPMVALKPGDSVSAEIGGLGAVSFTCTGEQS